MIQLKMRWVVVLSLFLAVTVYGKAFSSTDKKLVIGTKEAPPFSMKTDDGEWVGISIDLWRQIASDLEYAYEFRQYDLPGLLQGLETGKLDAAVGALTVTSEREKRIDFSHPFYATGLGITLKSKNKNPLIGFLKSLLSYDFLRTATGLIVLIFSVGLIVWWFEKKKNAEQFGDSIGKGIAAGFWWSAVTMTTVGYGDKAPKTTVGRFVAVIWMFAAVITISTFTAAISSSLTVQQLEALIKGPEDLPRVRVGTIAGTTSAYYLQKKRIVYRPFPNAIEGLEAVNSNNIDAFVYDAPLLRHLVNTRYTGILQVLPGTFLPQDYAIGLPPRSPLREPINRSLLQKISDPAWQNTLYRYLGQR